MVWLVTAPKDVVLNHTLIRSAGYFNLSERVLRERHLCLCGICTEKKEDQTFCRLSLRFAWRHCCHACIAPLSTSILLECSQLRNMFDYFPCILKTALTVREPSCVARILRNDHITS